MYPYVYNPANYPANYPVNYPLDYPFLYRRSNFPVHYQALDVITQSRQQSESLQQDLARAINGEYSAIHCYSTLAEAAPDSDQRNRILEIRRDEERHLRIFSRIYTDLTGRRPVPQITEQCPADYRAGLEAAFIDEQETVDFYLEAADRTEDPLIKEQFRRIKADEQNHAVWFLYLLYKQRHQ